MTEPMIPKGSKVLVTGVNSFIASHIADQFLTDGYNVRGTVRSQRKGDGLKKHFDHTHGKGRFDLAIVEDIALDDAFDEVVKGKLVRLV